MNTHKIQLQKYSVEKNRPKAKASLQIWVEKRGDQIGVIVGIRRGHKLWLGEQSYPRSVLSEDLVFESLRKERAILGHQVYVSLCSELWDQRKEIPIPLKGNSDES